MKHQYFGDLNDYLKYGLLRCIAEASKLPLGVHWLLTANDRRTDGELRRYLSNPQKWRGHDPHLFDALATLLKPDQERNVRNAAAWGLVPGATYFDHVVTDSPLARKQVMDAALAHLSDCPIVFLDPDNGIEVKSVPLGSKGSCKYVYWPELSMLFQRGHSVLVYQHYPRLKRDQFEAQVRQDLRSRLGAAEIGLFTTGRVAFFLALQRVHAEHLSPIISLVSDRWKRQIICGTG